MKKVLAIAVSILCLAGCNKSQETINNNNELVGTKWMTTGYSSMMSILLGGTWNKWYEFTSNSTLDCYWTDAHGNIIDSDGEFNYTYNYPDLIVTEKDSEITKYVFQDKRSFSYIRPDGSINKQITFFRQ